MGDRIIAARDELQVYLNQGGTISLRQTNLHGEESIVVIEPSDVDRVIDFLRETKQEALEMADGD